MSEMAKQARAAMKSKAKSLTTADPHAKVDSSTWTPSEPINADIQTGMRPVSRRAFKKGGKVLGEKAQANIGRKPRQTGGKALTANSLINRDQKEANAERPGGKAHVGAYKKGGAVRRKKREDGGSALIDQLAKKNPSDWNPENSIKNEAYRIRQKERMDDPEYNKGQGPTNAAAGPFKTAKERYEKESPKVRAMLGLSPIPDPYQDVLGNPGRYGVYKKGGSVRRKGRDDGGRTDAIGDYLKANPGPSASSKNVPLPPKRPSQDAINRMSSGNGSKDVTDPKNWPSDLARSQYRCSGGRTKKAAGGPEVGADKMMQDARAVSGVPSSLLDSTPARSRFAQGVGLKKGGAAHSDEKADMALIKKMVKPASLREGRKDGGGVFTGPGYPGKVPGEVAGGRTARATGGKTKGKGKTNINILISAGQKQPGMDAMGPPPAGGLPGGLPIPVPPPAGGGMPVGAPPPMPAPMPPAPPMARRSGGRISKVAKSFKDMTAGSGSGEGRLQKTDIAKARMGRKAGGKTYRSYKDMDAGSGSGLGRLEKTEIQAGKH